MRWIDTTMVGSLQMPKRLLALIDSGLWPRNEAEANRQNLKSLVPKERIQLFAPEEEGIYLIWPPFHTVAERMRNAKRRRDGEEWFWSTFAAPEGISPDLSVFIGDFGLGSDAPILLDYREDRSNPAVIRLKVNPLFGETMPNDRKRVTGWANVWLRCADTFDAFADMLGLEQHISS
jgi:hypothetical protein